jgi:hypothetical protein
MRDKGQKVYPLMTGYLFLSSNGLGDLYPLAARSLTSTMLGNETGGWIIFKSDEHGFNNPPGTFLNKTIDIALVGDSFTMGVSVDPSNNVSSDLINLAIK